MNTDICEQLLAAARLMDGTPTGEMSAYAAVGGIDAEPVVLLTEMGGLVRRVAGHLNRAGSASWDDADDADADQHLSAAMGSVHVGGRVQDPNLNLRADRAMTAVVTLARETDAEKRAWLADLSAKAQDPVFVAYVGAQLLWYFANITGDVEAFCDAMELELMEMQLINTKEDDHG